MNKLMMAIHKIAESGLKTRSRDDIFERIETLHEKLATEDLPREWRENIETEIAFLNAALDNDLD